MGAVTDAAAEPGHRRFDCRVEPGTDLAAALGDALEAAREAVESGQCIVLPTDTVYGIGADAFSPAAVKALLAAKGRGRDMPPPVLVAETALLRALATDVPKVAQDLVAEHWPGPLTVVLRAQPSLRIDLGDTDGTVALRVPDHPLAREVLRRTGPMAVSSANVTGRPAAQGVDEAVDQLGDRVAVYLDAGRVDGSAGAPSTIVEFTSHPGGRVLRHGALSVEDLRRTCPDLVDLDPGPGPRSHAGSRALAESEAESESGPEPRPVEHTPGG